MKGGGSLNRKVTCSNCGWSWKLVDGGTDPMTCHKCGGTIKMQNGGWLEEYQPGGFKKGLKQLLKEGLRDAGKAVKYDLPKKLNKNYFTPEPDKWYRQVGKSAIQDAKANKIIRETGEEVSPRLFQQFEEQLARMENKGKGLRPNAPFFSKGKLYLPMDDARGSSDYLIKTGLPNESFQSAAASSMWKATPKEVGEIGILKPDPALRNLEDFDLYQKNWWSGYKPISKKEMGGWLDSMQGGGDNGIDMSKVRMDFHPKSQIEAQEQLDYEKNYELEWKKQQAENKKKNIAAAVKKGVPKKEAEAIELSQENPRDQGEIRQHIPQTNLSKAVEIAANPGLALKNYRGGRLPDYFSSNQEVDMVDPLNVINMGYQFLTPMGRTAWALQSADNVDDDIKAGDYTGAAIDAAFALPGLREGKKFAQTLNKLNRVKNINNIRKAKNTFTFNPEVLKAQQQGLQKAKKIISDIAPKGKMYGENQVLTQQSRLLDPEIKAKFFEHQAPEIEAKIQSNILGEKLWKAPKDYGNRITPENYEEFVKKIHGSTNYDLAANSWKKPENLGIGNYGKPGTVYSDAPLNNLGKDIINAHEKNHGIFAGTMSTEMEKDLLKPFGTNKPVPFYQSKHQPDEVLARMAQFKNAIGMSDNQPFTLDHLNLIRKNYANSFLDNGITEMLNKIKPGSSGEKHFLNNMNKYAFGVGAPAAIGASALQEEEDGGWLDTMQKGGYKSEEEYQAHLLDPYSAEKRAAQIAWFKEKKNNELRKIMGNMPVRFIPKNERQAQEMLNDPGEYYDDEASDKIKKTYENIESLVKSGASRKQAEAVEYSLHQEPKEQSTIQEYIPQSKLSKAVEIAANPVTAMEDYVRSGYNRLPDHFSSNPDRDMLSPTEIANMGYQFLTPMGRTAWALQSADDVDRDLENEDYVSAGIDAAFVLPGLSQPKKWAKKLNKISRAKNIKNIKKTAKVQKETSPFTYKGVVEKFPGNTSLRNDLAKLKYNFVSQKQNPKLAGTWVNQHEEFMKGRPMSPDATGIIQPPADPNYLYNFKTYKQPPLEERFKNYKKEDGGFLDDEYRRGGQKRKKYTSKNIQSSVNDLFMRNETLFGPAGKKRYKPGLKYKSGGNWLDNLT
jgi:hypothetical protein